MRSSLALALLLLSACKRSADPPLSAVGSIEIIETDVASLVPARVVRVWVDEGQRVRPGDTLVTLSLPTSTSEVRRQRARVNAASARLQELRSGARAEEIRRARAEVAMAASEAALAQKELARMEPMGASNAVSQREVDAARTAVSSSRARLAAARQALALLQAGTRQERIRAGAAEVADAQAALAAVEASIADLALVARAPGTVLTRQAEPGEILRAGEPALTLGDPRRPYTRVYVSSLALPGVQLGQRVEARLDGLPEKPFAGQVVSINDRAEFTPRVALTEKERADLLFGVKVDLDDSTGVLKPGLPIVITFPQGTR